MNNILFIYNLFTMWNLLKNVFRSFKKNKIFLIGLTFLTFLSVGFFTILKTTTYNIDTTYQKVSTEGNQHNFTVSESYNVGNINYEPGSDTTKPETFGRGWSSDGYLIFWPEQTEISPGQYSKTYYFRLIGNESSSETMVDSFYNTYKSVQQTDSHYQYIYHSITITNNHQLTYLNDSSDHKSTYSNSEILSQLQQDLPEINSAIGSYSENLYNYLTTSNTPMQDYLDSLSDDLYYRNANVLKLSNSSDGIYYDISQTQPEDVTHPYDKIVDREVIFNSINNIEGWHNFSQEDWKPNNVSLSNDEIVTTLSYHLENWDVVSIDENKQNIIRNFFKILVFGQVSETSSTFFNDVKNINDLLTNNPDDFSVIQTQYQTFITNYELESINNKQYSLIQNWKNISSGTAIPFTWKIDNWTSEFAIVSPQFMEKHNLYPLTDVIVQEYKNNTLNNFDPDFDQYIKSHSEVSSFKQFFIDWLNTLTVDIFDEKYNHWRSTYKSCFINVSGDSGIPYAILASGITGDFVYPVVSMDRPIPNSQKECIVFTNKVGFERTYNSFRGNQIESYLVGKFLNGVNQQELLNQINEKAKTIMNWPENVKAAYFADDTTNKLNSSAFRISFVPSFVNKIDFLDYILTIFVVILSTLISAIIVRRYISNNRVNIGVIRSNGVSKTKIILSLIPFSFVPAVIGGISGYLLGMFLQIPALNLFSTFWTLPTSTIVIDWVPLVFSFIIPFLLFSIVSIITTLLVLRKKVTELMKPGSEYKFNFLTKNVKKLFNKFGVITKFRVSIAFSSLWKLFVLCIMTTLALSSLVFTITLNNKFDSAISQTSITKNYEYAVDLYTPTDQGGQYIPTNDQYIGKSGWQTSASNVGNNFLPGIYSNATESQKINSDQWYGIENNLTNDFVKDYYLSSFIPILGASFSDYIDQNLSSPFSPDLNCSQENTFLPLISDAIGEYTDVSYLKNRIMTKLCLNYQVGISVLGLSSNPWDIASSLMDINTKNNCEIKYQEVLNHYGDLIYNLQDPDWTSYKDYLTKNSDDTYSINTKNAINWTGTHLDSKFIQFLWKIYDDQEFQTPNTDYSINYNIIPLNKNDETYTYVDATFNNKWSNESIKIIGVDKNSKAVNLINSHNENILNLLSNNVKATDEYFPIIINELAAKKRNISIGQYLELNPTNTTNRFTKKIYDNYPEQTIKFKVVGISSSRLNEEYFIDQQVANLILGLRTKLLTNNEQNPNFHNNYINYTESCHSTITVEEFDQNSRSSINDISELSLSKDLENSNYNIIPYGFNGVFINDVNNTSLLNSRLMLYSPSGIWASNDNLLSDSSKNVFKYGANTQIINELTGFYNKTNPNSSSEIGKKIFDLYNQFVNGQTYEEQKQYWEQMNNLLPELLTKISEVFGSSTYVSCLSDVTSKTMNQDVYISVSNSINKIEIVLLSIIILMVFFVVLLICSMIITDSRKLAALLKSLGYSDSSNALSFMSIYLPVIIIGVLLSIPLSLGFLSLFQLTIMNSVGLLLNVKINVLWYIISVFIISIEFILSVVFMYIDLKKSSLVDSIK